MCREIRVLRGVRVDRSGVTAAGPRRTADTHAAPRRGRVQSDRRRVASGDIYFLFCCEPWSRDTRRTLTRVSKVNVWAMSSLLGVW